MSGSSLLVPAYDLVLGDHRWTTQALAVDVELNHAPLVDVVRVTFPASAPIDVGPDDLATLVLDNGDGSGPVTVFTGVVRTVGRAMRSTTVTCVDAGALLAGTRPSTTFEQATAASVIQALCDDAGVDVGPLDSGPTLTAYVADPGRSTLDHIARLASWSGALAAVDGDGAVGTRVIDGTQPEVALLHGRELVAVDQRRTAATVESFVVAGEAGATALSPPLAARPTSDFFAGDRPDGPGPGSRWRFDPALRTTDAAAIASAARKRSYDSSRHRTTIDAWLLPALRPGTVVRVDDLPAGLEAGPHWVEHVRHRLGPAGATTTARLSEGGPAFDPMAMLSGLAGAVGSLL